MPTIRGTGIQASSASSYTVSWPSGTVAGDFALIFAAGGWAPSAPSGWAALDQQNGGNWNGAVYTKTLTSADITAGSVTVAFSGTFDAVIAIVTLVGASLAEFPGVLSQRNGSGSSSITLSGAATDGSLALYFGSNRAASTDTVNRGTSQQTANDGSNASGCLYAETSPPASVSPTFSYGTAGSGNYQAAVSLVVVYTDYGGDVPAPAAPTLSSSSGGSLGATTYFVKATWTNANGETTASGESSLAVAANHVLVVQAPVPLAGEDSPTVTGWNVYVSTSTGTETKQNTSPIAVGTNWTEPTSGLISGSALPSSNTAAVVAHLDDEPVLTTATGQPAWSPNLVPLKLSEPLFGYQPPAFYGPIPADANIQDAIAAAGYSNTLTTQGGTSPYTYAVTSGALPTGLSLSSAGVISGVPTTLGAFTFTVTATDANGHTGSQAFTLTVTTPMRVWYGAVV